MGHSEVDRDKRMIWAILLLLLSAHLGESCSSKPNQQGESKGSAMKKISSTVCDNFESGTDEEVYINFKLDNNFCSTKILDTGKIGDWEINDWARGKTQEWGHETWKSYWGLGETQNHNFLGEC